MKTNQIQALPASGATVVPLSEFAPWGQGRGYWIDNWAVGKQNNRI